MICRIIFGFLLLTSSLYGSEFRIIRLESNPGLGMFATANQILGQLYLFDKGQLYDVSGLTVDFECYGLYYDPNQGPNWWTYYFEPLSVGTNTNALLVYPTQKQYYTAWQQRRLIPRATAAEIIEKYIRIKPHIQEKIDTFASQYFGHYTIGIHYRGTDKSKEAPRIKYEIVFKEIDKHIPLERQYMLFIATDELSFLEQAKARYPDRVVALEAQRSDGGGVGIHFENKNNYALGEEALMDACLLSKCDILIRTSSNLSLWSTYFNPALPVVLLNRRYMKTLEAE